MCRTERQAVDFVSKCGHTTKSFHVCISYQTEFPLLTKCIAKWPLPGYMLCIWDYLNSIAKYCKHAKHTLLFIFCQATSRRSCAVVVVCLDCPVGWLITGAAINLSFSESFRRHQHFCSDQCHTNHHISKSLIKSLYFLVGKNHGSTSHFYRKNWFLPVYHWFTIVNCHFCCGLRCFIAANLRWRRFAWRSSTSSTAKSPKFLVCVEVDPMGMFCTPPYIYICIYTQYIFRMGIMICFYLYIYIHIHIRILMIWLYTSNARIMMRPNNSLDFHGYWSNDGIWKCMVFNWRSQNNTIEILGLNVSMVLKWNHSFDGGCFRMAFVCNLRETKGY